MVAGRACLSGSLRGASSTVGWPVPDVGNGRDLLGWGGVDGKARDSSTAFFFF